MRKTKYPALAGPSLVAVAAVLWATDPLFRLPAALRLEPWSLVLIEHLIGVALLLVVVLARRAPRILQLEGREWLAAGFVGIAGSALGTVLFTASFRYLNPSVSILLQKLQPVVVVLIGAIVLGERPKGSFYRWAALAGAAAIFLSFPTLDFGLGRAEGVDHFFGIALAGAACLLWGSATVVGKILLERVDAPVAALWRYVFGAVSLSVYVAFAGAPAPVGGVTPAMMTNIVAMAVVSGVLPILAFYSGLARTSVSVASFLELVYPVAAVILNAVVLGRPIGVTEALAATVLLFAVTRIVQEGPSARRASSACIEVDFTVKRSHEQASGLRVQELRYVPEGAEVPERQESRV